MATTIAEQGPIAVRETKRAIDAGGGLTRDDRLALVLDQSDKVSSSEDMTERARAFFE